VCCFLFEQIISQEFALEEAHLNYAIYSPGFSHFYFIAQLNLSQNMSFLPLD
jgi:hypothetical protein